jgi:hypothetical protein
MGINPQDLGSFTVNVSRRDVEDGTARKLPPKKNGGAHLKQVRTVDSKNYKKHGITHALG